MRAKNESFITSANKIKFTKENVLALLTPLRTLDLEEQVVITVKGEEGSGEILSMYYIGKDRKEGQVTPDEKLFEKVFTEDVTGVIVSHTHPNGNGFPSTNDFGATECDKQICDNHDVAFIDHIIVGAKYFYSFKDEKMLDCDLNKYKKVAPKWYRPKVAVEALKDDSKKYLTMLETMVDSMESYKEEISNSKKENRQPDISEIDIEVWRNNLSDLKDFYKQHSKILNIAKAKSLQKSMKGFIKKFTKFSKELEKNIKA